MNFEEYTLLLLDLYSIICVLSNNAYMKINVTNISFITIP